MKNDKKRFSVHLLDGHIVIDEDKLKSVDLNHFSWDNGYSATHYKQVDRLDVGDMLHVQENIVITERTKEKHKLVKKTVKDQLTKIQKIIRIPSEQKKNIS
jgi:translation initiation factor 2 gamma subunit (eIF-2gamma)